MLCTVIDIGSNTVKMNIFDVDTAEKKPDQIHMLSTKCSLATHRMNGYLDAQGIEKLKKTLLLYLGESVRFGCDKCFAFATASLRGISNTAEVLSQIKKATGVDIDIISGEDEADCSYKGLKYAYGSDHSGAMADMGGGSCEIVLFDGERIGSCVSLPFGSLKLKNIFCKGYVPSEDEEKEVRESVLSHFKDEKAECLYLIGGTARGIFKLYGGEETDCRSFVRFYNELKNKEDIVSLLEKQLPERADSFLVGYFALCTVAERLGASCIRLCKSGAREGYLIKKLGI